MSLQNHSTVSIFHMSCIACESPVSRLHTAASEATTLQFPLDTWQTAEIKSIESRQLAEALLRSFKMAAVVAAKEFLGM